MKTEDLKAEFIKQRIAGNSFEQIATNLDIPKPDLIEWNKDSTIKKMINEGLAIHLNDTVKGLEIDRQSRLIGLLKVYKNILSELEDRDLKDVPTDKLIKLSILLNEKITEQGTAVEIGENLAIKPLYEAKAFKLNPLD